MQNRKIDSKKIEEKELKKVLKIIGEEEGFSSWCFLTGLS